MTSPMFPLGFNSKWFCLRTLLWTGLLFDSRCDDALMVGDTSELGVLGLPDVQVSVVTITTTIDYNPTPTDRATDSPTREGSDTATNTNHYSDEPSQSTEDGNSSTVVSLLPDTSPSLANAASALLKATDNSKPTQSKSELSSTPDISVTMPPSPGPSPLDSPDVSKSTVSTSAIAAIVSSISGFIILVAFLFLCARAYQRKKHQEEELPLAPLADQQLEHRSSLRLIPSIVKTTDNTDRTDFAPTTPALESGSNRHSSGLHARISPTSQSSRDTLYERLFEEVRTGPANSAPAASPTVPSLPADAAATSSSAVQWRGSPEMPSTASTALFDFDFRAGVGPSSSLTTPAATARPEGTLGDRAWNRRKMSTTFQPPPSGPPSVPLPPTPPRPQRKEGSLGMEGKEKMEPVVKEERLGREAQKAETSPTTSESTVGSSILFPSGDEGAK
ncbi:uncharacterized protein F4822DRAFT_425192 [Hypoxylon trugodes]|uniref:uncharacterized protein n=1 Tax=Hypoxylon trugodes TaxID=326681 RepID=UPI00218D21D0|nr:uncharacterized protein F4822DRAFT_425192 [Hypoxylon trugodes]KAI1391975.1 hypothetical protein F4822DRAFT_425192 [Hypoxylon trugodes]